MPSSQRRKEEHLLCQGRRTSTPKISRKASYGYRWLCAQIRNLGHQINHKAVQRIVQKLELQVCSFTRKSRKYSSYRGAVGNIADNLLNRRFHTCIPHQKITTDTSDFKYWLQERDGKPVADSCISIHSWISLTRRSSASISGRHHLRWGFRQHLRRRFA